MKLTPLWMWNKIGQHKWDPWHGKCLCSQDKIAHTNFTVQAIRSKITS